jgi:glutathione S-transferase
MLTLMDRKVSGNCWRVRLMLSFLGIDARRVEVDIVGNDQHSEAFRALNPRGQVPVLVDGGVAIWDSCAILVYLAAKHQPRWLASDPLAQARQEQFLVLANVEHQTGIRASRAKMLFDLPIRGTIKEARDAGLGALRIMDDALAASPWLAGDAPTVADVACYPYARLAPDGGIKTAGLLHLQRWLSDFEAFPGFVGLADGDVEPFSAWTPAA